MFVIPEKYCDVHNLSLPLSLSCQYYGHKYLSELYRNKLTITIYMPLSRFLNWYCVKKEKKNKYIKMIFPDTVCLNTIELNNLIV